MEQCVETYWIACRELWRETDLKIRLAGGKGGEEPSFRPKPIVKGDKSKMRRALKELAR